MNKVVKFVGKNDSVRTSTSMIGLLMFFCWDDFRFSLRKLHVHSSSYFRIVIIDIYYRCN